MSLADDLTQKIPDGFQIAKIFRNQVNLNTKAAFSAATLQGEEAPSEDQDQGQRGQKCFDGHGKHTFDRCYYLRKDLRPEGWQMSPGRAKLMMQGLQQNKAIREKYKEAYKEIENFLREAKKKDSKLQVGKTSEEQPKSVIGSTLVIRTREVNK